MNQTVPKILLLVNSNPYNKGIGELFLKEVVPFYPIDQLVRYSTVQSNVKDEEMNWCGFLTYVRQVKMSSVSMLSSYHDWKFRNTLLDDIVKEMLDVIDINSVNMVWAVLNSSITIHLVNRLLENINIPVVSTVWDSPQYFAINFHLNRSSTKKLYQNYANVLQHSLRVSVISDQMMDIFREEYGVNSIVWRHGINRKLWQKNKHHKKDIFIMGFAGSLYAKDAWNALIKALDSVNGIIEGKKVIIKFIGRFPKTVAKRSKYLEFIGHMSIEDTIKSLAEVDIAYLPYWFDKKYDYVIRTAFPGKLSTYLAADVPVIYHGPINSTPTKFISKYSIGLCCHSLDVIEILRVLKDCISDPSFNYKFNTGRKNALENELNSDVMLDQFASLVGIKRKMLLRSGSGKLNK